MKFTIIQQRVVPPSRYSIPDLWFFPDSKEIQIDSSGMGTKLDPIVIDNSSPIPKRFTIRNNKLHIHAKNIKSKKLGLDISENITFENCEFSQVRLLCSSNIKFESTIISSDIRLRECENIALENCFIKKIIQLKSKSCNFKECYIVQLRDFMSKNNNYEKNRIGFLETNVKEASFNDRNVLKDNNIKKFNYRLKQLFLIGPKALISDKMFWSLAIFLIFFCLGLFLYLDYIKNNITLLYLFLYSPFIYIAILFFYVYIYEWYYRIKLRILSKK